MFQNSPEMQAQILELEKLIIQKKSPLLDALNELQKAQPPSLPIPLDTVIACDTEVLTIQSDPVNEAKD